MCPNGRSLFSNGHTADDPADVDYELDHLNE